MEPSERTILLVEDNEDHAALVIHCFEKHTLNGRIIHVSDGETALDYLFRNGEYSNSVACPIPHLVILDLRLPRIDGLTVLKEIRASERGYSFPVVVLTTSGAEKDIKKAYSLHANSYLIKPSDYNGWVRLIESLSTYWLGYNHYPRLCGHSPHATKCQDLCR